MKLRIIITTFLLLPLCIHAAEESTHHIDFSNLLYTSEDILSTSAAVRESFSLRPLPEITSQLLADRSHFTSRDTQGNTLLDALVNNTSITLESPAQKLLSFIIHNTPVTEREVMITTILENAIKREELTFILMLLNNHPTQIAPSSRRQILYTAAATGKKELIEKLLPWYEDHNQLTNPFVDTMREIVDVMIKKAVENHFYDLVLYLVSRYPHFLKETLTDAIYCHNNLLIETLLDKNQGMGNCITQDIFEDALCSTVESNNLEAATHLISWGSFNKLPLGIETYDYIVKWAVERNYQSFLLALSHYCEYAGTTTLLYAVSFNNRDILEMCLQQDSPLNTCIADSEVIEDALVIAIQAEDFTTIDSLVRWYNEHAEAAHYQSTEKVLAKAITNFVDNVDTPSIIRRLVEHYSPILERYPWIIENAIKSAFDNNNPQILQELLDENSITGQYALSWLSSSTLEHLIEEEHITLYKNSTPLIIEWCERHNRPFRWSHEEYMYRNFRMLIPVAANYIRERDESRLIQLLEKVPALIKEVFALDNESHLSLIVSLMNQSSFLLEQFLNWRTPEGNTLPVECIHNLFMYAVQKNNISLVKSLLKKYSFAGNEVRKMILLKSFPPLVTDAIFKYSTHSDRELTPSLLLTALQSAQKQKYFNMVALLFSQLSRFNSRPFTDTNAKDIITSCALFGHKDTLFLMLDHYPHLVNDALLSALKGKQQDILIDLCKRCEKEKPDLPKALALAAAKSGHVPITFSLLGSYPDTLSPALEGACIGEQHTLLQTLLTQNTSIITPEMIHTLCVSAIAKHPASVNPIIGWIEQENPSLSDTLIPKIVGSAAYHEKLP